MCGIAGMLVRPGQVPDLAAVDRMQQALHHRGPDGQGAYRDDLVALAHTRLSIIDLAGGAQPLYSHDRKHVLIINGEIYNYVELRERFVAEGYPFATASDCEVILPLYARYGSRCVEHLRGMFAFALWDTENGRLLLARDRMGEKPLYLYRDGETLVFASELRAMLASGRVPRRVDAQALRDFFFYQFVPEPRTAVAGVFKLPAATTLTVDVADWREEERCYWRMMDAEPIATDPARALNECLDETIRLVLRADVPIGLSLSGGMDSSAIACLAARVYPGRLTAISAGYREPSPVDERAVARQLAGQLGIDFIEVEIGEAELEDGFADMVAARDEPIGDISGYAYERVMQAAREHGIPVMLQGQGVDEMFWGYPWVKDSVARNQPFTFAALLAQLTARRPWRDRARGMLGYLREQGQHGPYLRFFDSTPHFAWMQEHAAEFFAAAMVERAALDPRRHFARPAKGARMDLEATRLITELYLRGNGIPQCDRLAMAHAVESRLPFLDYRFIETAIGLRKFRRDDELQPKQRFQDSLCEVVPREVFTRPKRGFTPPVFRWQDRVRARYGGLLEDGHLVHLGVLQPDAARRVAAAQIEQPMLALTSRLALVLEVWLRAAFGASTPELV
ncbi:MAG: asparagine synthase (glutamine-hydrolyzing) [Gammaproteobacteria bacterium]